MARIRLPRSSSASALLAAAALALTASAPAARAGDPGLACERAAGRSLAGCIRAISTRQGRCVRASGRACEAGDVSIERALSRLGARVRRACPDDPTVRSAGYGPAFTVEGLVGRLGAECVAEAASLAARSFGGPQAAALAGADAASAACLEAAHASARRLLARQLGIRGACIGRRRGGATCDLAAVERRLDRARAAARDRIAAACTGAPALPELIAVDLAAFLDRAVAQSECATAVAHPDPAPLALACGPRPEVPAAPRGSYVQVVLDGDVWGTRCGDGSPYAFWIRLAPAGSPPENVVLQMQGGGVCIFESDCARRSADHFEALSDPPGQSGIMSNDPAVSPFADWTKVYLPYCTQDVFIGGGTTSDFPSVTVHRFGGLNVRAALRYVRDALWRELDATTAGGYRPDRVRMLFGGTSAGGFGTLYNYHFVLDDLQWAHTAAWPDASLALDNGEALGIASLGVLLTLDTPPLGWGARNLLPPYCHATNCGVGPVLYAASAPRLEAVPEQRFLVLSNQVDSTQVSTTFFPDAPTWINAMRQSYCDTRGLRGLRYFLPAIPQSVHVISVRESLFTGLALGGVVMRDWLETAMDAPAALSDAVEEGTLTTAIPGVGPFPCPLG